MCHAVFRRGTDLTRALSAALIACVNSSCGLFPFFPSLSQGELLCVCCAETVCTALLENEHGELCGALSTPGVCMLVGLLAENVSGFSGFSSTYC